MLKEKLGSKLLTTPLQQDGAHLPSPTALKNKIIIKVRPESVFS